MARDILLTNPSGGITNSAGANVVPKSNGTNLVASRLTDNSATENASLAAGLQLAPPAPVTDILAIEVPEDSVGAVMTVRDHNGEVMMDFDAEGHMALFPIGGVGLSIETTSAQFVPFIVRTKAGGDLQFRIMKGGAIATSMKTAPPNDDFAPAEVAIWFDEANSKVKFKALMNDTITFKTGEISLT